MLHAQLTTETSDDLLPLVGEEEEVECFKIEMRRKSAPKPFLKSTKRERDDGNEDSQSKKKRSR